MLNVCVRACSSIVQLTSNRGSADHTWIVAKTTVKHFRLHCSM